VYKYFSLSMRSMLRCSGSPMSVAQILAEALRGLLHADRCTVFVIDEVNQTLRATIPKNNNNNNNAVDEESKTNTTDITLKFGEGFAGRCAQDRKPIVVNNAYEDQSFYANVDAISGYVTKTVLTVPLVYEGKLLAVVQLLNKLGSLDNNKQVPKFGEEDLELFEAFCAVSGVVIRDALLRPEVRRLQHSNKMMSEVCSALVTANYHDQADTAAAVAD
jgi:GAF domain-containing protein